MDELLICISILSSDKYYYYIMIMISTPLLYLLYQWAHQTCPAKSLRCPAKMQLAWTSCPGIFKTLFPALIYDPTVPTISQEMVHPSVLGQPLCSFVGLIDGQLPILLGQCQKQSVTMLILRKKHWQLRCQNTIEFQPLMI